MGLDDLKKIKVFLMTMPMVTAGQDPPGGDIQGRKKGRGSVPDIVVGNAFHITKSDRQDESARQWRHQSF